VYFGFIGIPIILANDGNALQFPPSAAAILATKPSVHPHAATGGDDLDLPDGTLDFEFIGRHWAAFRMMGPLTPLALPPILPAALHLRSSRRFLSSRGYRRLARAAH
jgi:hypothetical protein